MNVRHILFIVMVRYFIGFRMVSSFYQAKESLEKAHLKVIFYFEMLYFYYE